MLSAAQPFGSGRVMAKVWIVVMVVGWVVAVMAKGWMVVVMATGWMVVVMVVGCWVGLGAAVTGAEGWE